MVQLAGEFGVLIREGFDQYLSRLAPKLLLELKLNGTYHVIQIIDFKQHRLSDSVGNLAF